jgi:hypothetical protein
MGRCVTMRVAFGGLTWLVQTLLKVTNAKVCASNVDGRSFFARQRGMATIDRNICGMNAADSMRNPVTLHLEELRYRRMLYGEKLWRWSMRVTW